MNYNEDDQTNLKNPSKVFSFYDSKKQSDSRDENFNYKANKYINYGGDYKDNEYNVSSELRLLNLERRLEKNEKLLNYFEEMLRLKDEEKKNDILIDKNTLKEYSKRISILEDHISIILKKFSEFSDIFSSKIEKVEKLYKQSTENKDKLGEFYATKLSELDGILKKNDILIENKVEQGFIQIEKNIDAKIEDLLSLINEISKIGEENEAQILDSKETIRLIQTDHIDFIKIVGILKEKSDSLEYIYKEIGDLKQKYQNLLISVTEQSQEDDKILHNMFNAEVNNPSSNNRG